MNDLELRSWILSRMELDENCIVKAINKTQYVFWQVNQSLDELRPQIYWNTLDSASSPYNEYLKKLYFALGNRADRLRQKLERSKEWKMFEQISNENIIWREILQLKIDFNYLYTRPRLNLADIIRNSKDVLQRNVLHCQTNQTFCSLAFIKRR